MSLFMWEVKQICLSNCFLPFPLYNTLYKMKSKFFIDFTLESQIQILYDW